MSLWKTLSNDPKKLAAVSDFLTGFGSGINAGNKPGVSPLAALSMGFQGGTQGIKEAENRRRETAYKEMQMQQLMAQHKANQAKLVKEQEALKRNAAFTQAAQGLDPDSDTYKRDLTNLAIKYSGAGGVGGTNIGALIKNVESAEDKAKAKRAASEEERKVAEEARKEAKAARDAELHQFKLSEAESKANAARQEEQEKAYEVFASKMALQSQGKTAKDKDALIQAEIKKAVNLLNENPIMGAGFMGNLLKYVGGTQASNIESALTMIKANLGFEQMQAMKNATPTGATGLGQIAIKEFEALQSSVRSLDQKQESGQLKESLKAVSRHLARWSAAVQEEAAARGEAIDGIYGGGTPQADTGIGRFTVEVVN